MGVSIGWFSVKSEIGDVEAIAERIKEICGPSSSAFPFAVSPVQDENREEGMAYAVIRGHVPIHLDRANPNQRSQSMFMFVLTADNRPVLLASPSTQENSACVLVPDQVKAPRMMFGAVELWPGRAVHIDITSQFHGITGFPTGDPIPEVPEAVMIQVPWARPDDIGGAIQQMKRLIRRDDRFADLVTVSGGGGQ